MTKMSMQLAAGIVLGSTLGFWLYSVWGRRCYDRVEVDRFFMRERIREYLRTGAINTEYAAELTEKMWRVDYNTHAHYIRTFRDPRVLYPSELSW